MLFQVFTNRMIIGKISVVNQSFIQTGKWMGATRMPYTPLGRVTLVRNPSMCLKVIQLIILYNFFCITHYL